MLSGNPAQRAAQAEAIAQAVTPGVFCTAQDWDERIDCCLKLGDGSVIGEMIPFDVLSEDQVRACADRLRRRAAGEDVKLLREIKPPQRIVTG